MAYRRPQRNQSSTNSEHRRLFGKLHHCHLPIRAECRAGRVGICTDSHPLRCVAHDEAPTSCHHHPCNTIPHQRHNHGRHPRTSCPKTSRLRLPKLAATFHANWFSYKQPIGSPTMSSHLRRKRSSSSPTRRSAQAERRDEARRCRCHPRQQTMQRLFRHGRIHRKGPRLVQYPKPVCSSVLHRR